MGRCDGRGQRPWGPTRHLITSEVFIRAPAAKLAQKLGGFSSIRVLFYLRPHIDMFAAAYAQAVKTGNCMRSAEKAFPRFIASREVDFVAAVEDYLSVFGGDAVQCREYARAHFPGGDVVRDFADFCALPGLAPLAEAVVATERNLSPGAEILSLLLHVRQYLPRKVEAPRALQLRDMVFLPLLRALAETLSESTRYRPPVAIQERLKEQFEPGRRQLGERLGMTPLSAAWYDEPIYAPETPKNRSLIRSKRPSLRSMTGYGCSPRAYTARYCVRSMMACRPSARVASPWSASRHCVRVGLEAAY